MPNIILKSNTIQMLLKFAQNINQQGLVSELPSQEKADNDQLSTYIDATNLYDSIQVMKKNDDAEWQKLRKCSLRNWADPRTNHDGDTFESCFDGVFKDMQCVSALKATVARFLYEQVDTTKNDLLNEKVKIDLRFQCLNEFVDINWKIQSQPSIFIQSISQTPDHKTNPASEIKPSTATLFSKGNTNSVQKDSKHAAISLTHK
jgi:hypothetical protein